MVKYMYVDVVSACANFMFPLKNRETHETSYHRRYRRALTGLHKNIIDTLSGI
jgi:hypothetical protein